MTLTEPCSSCEHLYFSKIYMCQLGFLVAWITIKGSCPYYKPKEDGEGGKV